MARRDSSLLPPDDASGGPEETAASPERLLLRWFFALVGLTAILLVWLAFREDAPEFARVPMDFMMNTSLGALLAYVAFRALFLYQFRLVELFLIVLVLSFGIKLTLDFLRGLALFGLIEPGGVGSRELGGHFPVCLVVCSMLLSGAALGLRSCHVLKSEGTVERLFKLVAGMLALPAAAGVFAFPVMALSDVFLSVASPGRAGAFLGLWAISVMLTAVNLSDFVKTLTLKEEIQAREKMP